MRECGSCTACCHAFHIEWLDKPKNEPCTHCTGTGCSIHASKHFECDSFECAYIQSNIDNDNLRPDKCGIIFELLKDGRFLATVIEGAEVTDSALNQMNSFTRQGYKVMINGNI